MKKEKEVYIRETGEEEPDDFLSFFVLPRIYFVRLAVQVSSELA